VTFTTEVNSAGAWISITGSQWNGVTVNSIALEVGPTTSISKTVAGAATTITDYASFWPLAGYIGPTEEIDTNANLDWSLVTAVELVDFHATGYDGGVALFWQTASETDNLGFNVTTLVASLGIGGVAVALAVQNILGDLFASLSIALDKPFVIGDFIVVDDIAGTVEHVGLKTTRVRSLSGEQVVFSNADLLKSRIHNYKRLYERRVLFGFGVLYRTPPEQLAAIPPMVREIITGQVGTRFDRAHFKGFGASSLDFEVVYFVLDPDYNRYMDIQQAINLELVNRFAAAGVEFAFPTRTVHIEALPTATAEPAGG